MGGPRRVFCQLERALSLRSSSINSFLGGPRRVFCQLDIFAYTRRVILHKYFVDVRRQRPGGSTFGCATGKIIAFQEVPERSLPVPSLLGEISPINIPHH